MAIPNTACSTVDAKADPRVRTTATQQATRGAAMRQALELALQALERSVATCFDQRSHDEVMGRPEHFVNRAITAIKEALAQPEEEKLHPVHIGVDVTKEGTAVTAFYRRPNSVMEMFYSQFHPLAQPEQEPVAWATREDFYRELDRSVERIRKEMEIKSVTMRCKDYDLALPIIDTHFGRVLVGQVSTPPQRTWVGLTDEERTEIRNKVQVYTSMDNIQYGLAIQRATETVLKEKNT